MMFVFIALTSEAEHFVIYSSLLVFSSLSCLFTFLVYVSVGVFVFSSLIYRWHPKYILYNSLFSIFTKYRLPVCC